MASRIALVTGCSSGIGLVTAQRLAQRAKEPLIVYATMRNMSKKDQLEAAAGNTLNKTLFIRELDVTKEKTIVETVSHILDTHGQIDVLVNNAGISGINIAEVTSISTFKKMFDVNFFGVVRMTQEVIPHMKGRRSGRIINISSLSGIMGVMFYDMYGSTKFALEGFSECLAMSLRHSNVWVSNVQPGPVETDVLTNPDVSDVLREQMDDPRVDEKTREMYRMIWKRRETMLTVAGGAQTASEIVDVVEVAVDSERPHLRYQTSEKSRKLAAERFKQGSPWFKDPSGDDVTGDYFLNS
ncbi:retinol dehydrogenase 8-like [Diadema antillarum]|uniref:retinol dehydrogenase 8-like n=1 Tax=Diadema antillarum TaxID=105358 RepID=UPI003A88E0D8